VSAARLDRLSGDWPTYPVAADDLVLRNQRATRARSRSDYYNNGYIRRFVRMVETNLVGAKGVILQARFKDETGTPDPLASQAVESAWQKWGQLKTCDSRRRLTWTGIQRQAASNGAIDGEILALTDETKDDTGYHFSVRLIDPELLDINRNEPLRNGGRIVMGIEMDALGAVVAYHLTTRPDTYSATSQAYATTQPVRIEADRVIHAYIPELIGQSRGMPWATAGLWDAHLIAKYGEAALVAARVGANSPMFIRDSEEAKFAGEGKDAQGNVVLPSEPGEYGHLAYNQELVAHDNKYPNGEFDPFVKACLRKFASSVSCSYNLLASDLEGVNYSSIRAGVLEEREVWKALQEWFIEAFVSEVYRRWLRFNLRFGTIMVPTSTGPMPLSVNREEKYHQVSWQARRWPWVDPIKDQQANKLALDTFQTSPQKLAREAGHDFFGIVDEVAEARDYVKAKGLDWPAAGATAPAATAPASGSQSDPAKEDNVDGNE
jgi:lambda family phage portal protein